jgi:hypothetical protein
MTPIVAGVATRRRKGARRVVVGGGAREERMRLQVDADAHSASGIDIACDRAGAPSGSDIAARIGSRCPPDARVIGDSPFWFERRRSDGDKRPRADTLGRALRAFPRDPRLRV